MRHQIIKNFIWVTCWKAYWIHERTNMSNCNLSWVPHPDLAWGVTTSWPGPILEYPLELGHSPPGTGTPLEIHLGIVTVLLPWRGHATSGSIMGWRWSNHPWSEQTHTHENITSHHTAYAGSNHWNQTSSLCQIQPNIWQFRTSEKHYNSFLGKKEYI